MVRMHVDHARKDGQPAGIDHFLGFRLLPRLVNARNASVANADGGATPAFRGNQKTIADQTVHSSLPGTDWIGLVSIRLRNQPAAACGLFQEPRARSRWKCRA